jgi:hypothetical protein
MNRLFFKIKERVFRAGPVLGNFILNYSIGIFLLRNLIKLRSFHKHRAREIENLTTLLGLLDVPQSQHEPIIEQYLFNNTWQNWKSLHYEQPKTFYKYWLIKDKETIEKLYDKNRVIIFLLRHTPLTNQHFSLMHFGFNFRFTTIGNTNSKKYLKINGQSDLPEVVMNNPLKYKQVVRKHQLKKILNVLANKEGYVINYFYDGQEGNNFRKGQIGNLHYKFSTDLLRFFRPHTALMMVEPSFNGDGSVVMQFHEVPRFTDFAEQFDYVQDYYERTFLTALPTLNDYMINQVIKNHHALKNSN